MIRHFLLLLCLLSLSLPAKADYFLDSVAGNDSNTGTSYWSPWKTVAKFTSVAGVTCSNTVITVQGGSYFREQLSMLGRGNTISVNGGPRPVFDASEIVTNWVQVCSIITNTWACSNFVATGGGDKTTIPVIEDGTIMIAVTSLLICEATPGSFFSPVSPVPGSTNTIFIHPSSSTSPVGRRYEVAKRNYGIVAGDDCRIELVVIRNQMHNNGSLEIGKRCDVRNVLLENGTVHHMLFQSGRLENVVASKASHWQGQTIPFVAYSQTDGLSVEIISCKAFGISPSRQISMGFYGHTANVSPDPGYAYVKLEDCEVTFAGGFGNISPQTNAFSLLNRCKAIGVSSQGFVTYGGHNVLMDCEFRTLPDVRFSPSGIPVTIAGGAGARTYISGLKCTVPDTMSPFNIRVTANNAWLSVVDSIIGYGNTIGISSSAVTNLTLSVSNCVIGSGQAYGFTGSVPNFAGDSNCYTFYPLQMNAHWGSEALVNWGQFKALVAPYEANSTTNDARWIGWPVNGEYAYDYRSPIVTNRAGPSWRPSARQSVHPLLQDIDPWLPPNLATGAKP